MSYQELRDPQDMQPGSLNRIHSEIFHLRRPPSLSDSFALSSENIERASSFRKHVGYEGELDTEENAEEDADETDEPDEPKYNIWEKPMNVILRFLFHILLISIFETIFFFHYVSTLEDKGILGTMNSLTKSLVQSCTNITEPERSFINQYLGLFINISNIQQNSIYMFNLRYFQNNQLYVRSWVYVGSIGSVFCFVYILAILQNCNIHVYKLFVENLCFVLMLAIYEFLFFSSIIVPYTPISSQEIVQTTVGMFEQQCGLF
jgi:hypothetical protein